MKHKPGKMRLPDNLCNNAQVKNELMALHHNGELKDMYFFFCKRLELLEMNVDADGNFYLDEQKVTMNQIWLILRKDMENQGYNISKKATMHIIFKGTEKIIADASALARKENCKVLIGFKD